MNSLLKSIKKYLNEIVFGGETPTYNEFCLWCGNVLTGSQRSFCSKHCCSHYHYRKSSKFDIIKRR